MYSGGEGGKREERGGKGGKGKQKERKRSIYFLALPHVQLLLHIFGKFGRGHKIPKEGANNKISSTICKKNP